MKTSRRPKNLSDNKAMIEAMKTQSEVNIGTTGHVDHGKTTLVQALSGEWTDRHSEEKRRGISIKLGYADAIILKCPNCPPPECYTTAAMAKSNKCPRCESDLVFVRRISFADSPGHEALMATMISGAALVDGAILVIAANEPCPQPQTREHFAALQIIGVKNLIIVQNKIELVSREKALENYRQILDFVKGTEAENVQIIPVSAVFRANLDVLIDAMERVIPTPKRDLTKPMRMYVARSFEVNKPGTPPEELKGGVIGGSIIQGSVKVGDEIEIRPGLRVDVGGSVRYEPLFTEVTSIQAGEGVMLEEAKPGGLIGLGTKLDPSLTKADGMVGSVAGRPGTLPPMIDSFSIEVNLLERVVGSVDLSKVEPIASKEPLMLNIGPTATVGTSTAVSNGLVKISLRRPVVAEEGQRIAISRRIAGRWRLIGWGLITQTQS
ncbi:MAG: translation initiation factor IF-2 subunit gamma [Candidatus Jordarchaeaceae archaeon]